MAIIGSAYVEIRGIDKFLQRDIDNAVKNIKVPPLNFTSDIDLTPVRRKITALRNEIKNDPLEFKVSADYQDVIDTLDVVKNEQEKDPIVFNVDTNVSELEKALDNIRDKHDLISSTIRADADTARAEAQLNATARDRHSNISASIDPETRNALRGLTYTLIGAVPADKIKGAITSVATNFEMLAISGAKLSTILGTVGAVGLATGADLFTLASDIGDVVGIIALAPAAFAAMGAGIAANIISWKGFGEAVTGTGKKGAEALAKLPIEAQKAAVALRGLGAQISKPVQKAFWVEMNTALQDTAKIIVPELAKGLTNTATLMGRMTSSILASFRQLTESGGLEKLFANINRGFDGATKGVKPFFDAMNTLAVSGSKFLGPLGDAIGNLGIRFNNFITEAERVGDIDRWIKESINSFKNLGSVVKSTFDIFGGISTASFMAGAPGLDDFARGMRNIADVVNGEPFRSRLVSVLEYARSGADALGEGFGKLSKLVGESTGAIGEFLQTAGQISGQLLTNITKLFDGTGLGTGLLTALWGFQDAVEVLEPGFGNLGKVLGDLGRIAGAVFQSMAPGLNNLLETLAGVTDGLTDGVIAAMPIFNEFFQALFAAAQGPIIAIAQGLGNLLQIFAQLPGPMQTVIITLGILVAFRSKITDLVTGIGTAFSKMRAGIEGDTAGMSGSMRAMYGHFSNAGTALSSVGTAIRNIPFATATSGLGGLATAAGGAAKSLGKAAGSGLMGALSGGMAMLGGPWGLAIGVGIAALSAFGQAQADSAARVKAFSDSLDQQTGHITNNTKKLVADGALDGATNGWDDFFRGVLQGSKSVEEALRTLGISTKDFTDKLANPTSRDSYIKGMEAISNAMRDGRPVTEEMAAAIGTTKKALEGVNGNTMRHLADEAKGTANELTKAEEKVKALAAATGTGSAQAAILSRNYETLASATSSASDKFSALKQNLDILNGGAMTAANSQKTLAQSLDDTKNKLSSIAADMGGSVQSLYSVKDGFNFASQAGRDFHTALEGSADSILKIGTAALDQALKAGKSTADAQSIAVQAMQAPVAALRQQLADVGLLPPQIDAVVRSFGLMPDQVSTAIDVTGTEEAQRKIFLTKLAADSFANNNYTGVLAALPDDAKKAIADATGTAEAFAKGDYSTILKALDQTGPGKEAALASILSVTNGNYEAALKALNLGGGVVDDAKAQALGYANGGYTAQLEAQNLADGPIQDAQAQALMYKNQDYTAELEAINNVGPSAADATAVANTFKNADYTAFLKAINSTASPVADATAAGNAFKNADYTAFLKALNITSGPVSDATGAAYGFSRTDFTAALKAADSTAGGRAAAAAAINATTGANYTAMIRAAADQGSIGGVQGALNALTAPRTVYINAVMNRANLPDLNGSASGSGRPGIANGGLFRTVRNQSDLFRGAFQAKMFANGGIENHIAQIARGGSMRVWAEPETGGEAYIPLALSKRIRSLKILEQVAQMFGYTLFKQFANGGILDVFNSRSKATSSSLTAASTVVSTPIIRSTASDKPNVSLTINSTDGYTPEQLAESAVSELAWQFLNR